MLGRCPWSGDPCSGEESSASQWSDNSASWTPADIKGEMALCAFFCSLARETVDWCGLSLTPGDTRGEVASFSCSLARQTAGCCGLSFRLASSLITSLTACGDSSLSSTSFSLEGSNWGSSHESLLLSSMSSKVLTVLACLGGLHL